MSYQTDFICTYKQMNDETSQEFLYRIQLLQALGLESWNDDDVNVIMNNTYEKIKDITVFRDIIEKAKKNKDLEFLLGLICASANANEVGANEVGAGANANEVGAGANENEVGAGANEVVADAGANTNNVANEICVDKLVFELLFKYEYFDLFHRCLSEQLRHGRVEDKIVSSMINVLS